ncbi:MAG: Serine/threonine protein kinase PrkC, regulator of stationary phase [Myxococcaceae bacterium]|nr:Serine/threonine protein kinase PrkC, regulator of stationary phase [Myxococcaceae bacterium]
MAEQRYRVIDRLEAGGMAEVFRGEALSVQGFKKQVAIKRVLPHLAQNKSFIRMFIDEARLGARLNHANIVTVFDIGAADNTYFIVMEFVDGANFKAVLEALKKQGRKPSVKEILYIGMEICKGLSHAHGLTDEQGKLLNIVHRDISPPNILMTKGGEVKVTDFGLAKATTQLEKTDPGVVKGKFSYLSPEAALGQEVDARTDVFAVGILMWEALAQRRLFLGDSDYETVKKVQRAEVPSLRAINPEVDEELDALLQKTMAREREERFQSAQELGDAIADFLFRHRLKVTSYDIARMMQSVLATRAGEQKKKLETSIVIDQLISDELLAFTSLDDMSDPLNPAAAGDAAAPERPKVPQVSAGAKPLDAGSFGQNSDSPNTWYADDDSIDEATNFFDRHTLDAMEASKAAGKPPAAGKPAAGKLPPPGKLPVPGTLSLPNKPSKGPVTANSNSGTSPKSDPMELAALLERDDETGRQKVSAEEAAKLGRDAARITGKNPRVADDRAGWADTEKLPAVDLPLAELPAKPPEPSVTSSGALKYVVIAVLLAGAGAAAWFSGLIPH